VRTALRSKGRIRAGNECVCCFWCREGTLTPTGRLSPATGDYNSFMAPASDVLAILRRVQIFSGLSEAELQFLSQRAIPRAYGKGEIVFTEGDPCTGLFVIESGQVRIFKSSPSGREQVLAVEGPGSSVAELPVFDGGNYPASTAAITDSRILFISKQEFHALCLVHPHVALKVLKVVGARLRRLVGIIEELSFTTVRSRLISVLVRRAKTGKKTSEGIEIELPPSNQELASEIGTVRELVSRNLSRLQAETLIHMDGKTVTIPDLKRLQAELESPE
jgi:CRP/FNR family cyclic AMP-dependent transcriptional regulator